MGVFFRHGRGALARHDTFWYPVRLIQQVEGDWRVRWWTGNEFTSTAVVAGGVSRIDSADIIDSLWLKAVARRTIRVSK